MSVLSDIAITNIALGLLGVSPITSFDDQTRAAVLAKTNYNHLRNAVLEDREWTFAVKRYIFDSPTLEGPVYGYTYAFNIPAEVMRVLSIPETDDDRAQGLREWVVEQRQILCNENPIYVRALIREERSTQFSEAFAQALAYRLAHQFCIPLTENQTHKEQLWKDYENMIIAASSTDGMQGRVQILRSTRLTGVR